MYHMYPLTAGYMAGSCFIFSYSPRSAGAARAPPPLAPDGDSTSGVHAEGVDSIPGSSVRGINRGWTLYAHNGQYDSWIHYTSNQVCRCALYIYNLVTRIITQDTPRETARHRLTCVARC